jgi:hypothetical protein
VKKTLLLFAALSLAACSKNQPSESSEPTLTGGTVKSRPVAVEEIRLVMLEQRPGSPQTINAIHIVNDDGVVTLHGKVDDEQMKKALVDRVKKMPGVTDVKDQLEVAPQPKAGSPGAR